MQLEYLDAFKVVPLSAIRRGHRFTLREEEARLVGVSYQEITMEALDDYVGKGVNAKSLSVRNVTLGGDGTIWEDYIPYVILI